MVQPLYEWRIPTRASVEPACLELAREKGVSRRLMALLAGRGIVTAAALEGFLAPVERELHDPALLPDAEETLRRVAAARSDGERVLVYGDFDADGLCGLSILVLTFRALGLDVAPYVPERLADGHGLSARAIDRAVEEQRTLIVTADCGTSSEPEIALARGRGIDVIVTDHHHAPEPPPSAVAVVNPQRSDSGYPERRLTGAGVAWKVAHLLLRDRGAGTWPLPESVAAMADLALIGTIADVAPVLGENRAIARLGLERLRTSARPGLAALMARAQIDPTRLDLEDLGYGLAPRINAAGRVGEAGRAAALLLGEDPAEAERLAEEIDAANRERRDITKTALAEARRSVLGAPAGEPIGEAGAEAELEPGRTQPLPANLPAAILIRGDWPIGIVGLVAGKLAEDLRRPVIVATSLGGGAPPDPGSPDGGTLRASCRSGNALNLAEALEACSDLLIRHGGHAAAAGFDISVENWASFTERFLALAEARAVPPARPEIALDLVLRADSVDFGFVRDLERLEPTGPGNPRPVLGLTGLRVGRVRPANGGHTQLVLKRSKDVLDAIAFRRPDLQASLHEGDEIDVAARASVHAFGGLETVQLEVLDVADAGFASRPAASDPAGRE